MTSPLESTNPHGIRVVADRAPFNEDVAAAFAKGSRKAEAGIRSLTEPKRQGRGAKVRADGAGRSKSARAK